MGCVDCLGKLFLADQISINGRVFVAYTKRGCDTNQPPQVSVTGFVIQLTVRANALRLETVTSMH